MGFDDDGLVFEFVEVGFDLGVFGFGVVAEAGYRELDSARWIFEDSGAALYIFGLGGGDLVSGGGDEIDARLVEADGLVAVVGDDDADGHEAELEVVHAKAAGFVFGVVGVGGDGDVFGGVGVEGGVSVGGLGGCGRVFGGEAGGWEHAEEQSESKGAPSHWDDYHLRLRLAQSWIGERLDIRASSCLGRVFLEVDFCRCFFTASRGWWR